MPNATLVGVDNSTAVGTDASPFHVTQMLGTPVNVSSGNVAAATANVALPAVSGKMNYITGFEITGLGATSQAVITVTLVGLNSGSGTTSTMTYLMNIPATSATTAISPLMVSFEVPMAAYAVNTAITLNVPSFGTGNTNAASCIHGFVA